MSYDDDDDRDDDRREYYRDLDRRDDDREADRRHEDFIEDMKRDEERADRDTEEAMAAARKKDVVSAALRMGLSDSAVYLLQVNRDAQRQSNRNTEEQSTAVGLGLLKQLAALRESELPEVLNILHDQSLSVQDRVFLAYTTARDHLHEEIGQVFLTLLQLNARDAKKFGGEMPRLQYLTQKRREFLAASLATINQLREKEKEHLTRMINSELGSG